MNLTTISDLHGHFPKLLGGDILIIAGDLTATDERNEYNKFLDWLEDQDYHKKIIVAGNHDNYLVKYPDFFESSDDQSIYYLCDKGFEWEGIKFWGSPWTRYFLGENPNCLAFVKYTDEELKKKWDLIPNDIDILITHSPPFGIMDMVEDRLIGKIHTGSESLQKRIAKIMALKTKKKNRVHIFGHIHERHGEDSDEFLPSGTFMKYINGSHVNEFYEPVNEPINFVYEK